MFYRSRSSVVQRFRLYLIVAITFIFSLGVGSAINCAQHVSLSLGPDCTLLVTTDMLLTDPGVNPAFVDLELTYGSGVVISDGILRMHHIGRSIRARVTCTDGSCGVGSCWTEITLHSDILPAFSTHLDTSVYCFDSLLLNDPTSDNYAFIPELISSCASSSGPYFSGDWIEVNNCTDDQDVAKIIYRQWYAESKEGTRVISFDTIRVLRLPSIADIVVCSDSDTSYCDALSEPFGPYLLVENPPGSGLCDTFYILNMGADQLSEAAKCGISFKVESSGFDTDCGAVTSYEVEIIQGCHNPAPTACMGMGLSDVTSIPGQRVFAVCSFWHMVLDTLGPEVTCIPGKDTIHLGDTIVTVVPASSHDCEADVYLPIVEATDLCTGVKYVKARVDNAGTVTYLPQPDGAKWRPDSRIRLPYSEAPYEVIIEAFDSCHNFSSDTCYILIKDQTRPIAVAHDTLNLSLSSKKIWVKPESFNQGSWDNCTQELIYLLRRSDWKDFCVDLCDSLVTMPVSGSSMDSLTCAVLSQDEGSDPIESYYQQYINWLGLDGEACGNLLYDAWHYALCQIGEVQCASGDLHEFQQSYSATFNPEDLDLLIQLGGGWTDAVPIGCEDLCSEVAVEMLVMDYWCNWSTTWTQVYVEDKVPPVAIAPLEEVVQISCTAFEEDRSYSVSGVAGFLTLDEVVDLAISGDSSALASLDLELGSYEPAWQSANGAYLDIDGNPIGSSIEFKDRGVCRRDTVVEQVRILDHASGSMVGRDSMIERFVLDTLCLSLAQGYVLTNCNENLRRLQEVEVSRDTCDNPRVTRTFKFWKACNGGRQQEAPDTLTLTQIIQTIHHCEFDRGMFSFPFDTLLTVGDCAEVPPMILGQVGGIADPSAIGDAAFIFDESCRRVGISYSDFIKVNVPSVPNFCDTVILRQWVISSWCPERFDTVIQKIGFRFDTNPTPGSNPDLLGRSMTIKQAYPNPFRDETVLTVTLDHAANIDLVITDVEGRVLVNRRHQLFKGKHQLHIDKSDFRGPGMYFSQIHVEGVLRDVSKLILIP